MGQSSPSSLQTDLEHRSKDTTGGLSDVDHIGDEGETVELELGNVGLEKNVDFRRGIVDRLFDRNRHSFKKFGEFESTKYETNQPKFRAVSREEELTSLRHEREHS